MGRQEIPTLRWCGVREPHRNWNAQVEYEVNQAQEFSPGDVTAVEHFFRRTPRRWFLHIYEQALHVFHDSAGMVMLPEPVPWGT